MNTPGFTNNPLHETKLDVIKEETEEGLSATPVGNSTVVWRSK